MIPMPNNPTCSAPWRCRRIAAPRAAAGRCRRRSRGSRSSTRSTTADCQCGECQAALTPISEKVTEQLDIQPARVQVLRHVRKTYACKACDGKPVTAPMPNQPIPRSLASPGTLAHVAVAKYVDGLPLYRQEKKLARIGVAAAAIDAGALDGQGRRAGAAADQPASRATTGLRHRRHGRDPAAGAERARQNGPQSQSYLWVQRGGPPDHPILLYDYDPSRSQKVPIRLLEGFCGYLHDRRL